MSQATQPYYSSGTALMPSVSSRRSRGSRIVAAARKRRRVAPAPGALKRKVAMLPRYRRRVPLRSRTLTNTRRRRVTDHISSENTSRSLTTRGKGYNVGRMLNSIMDIQYYRVQGLSQYDTEYGFHPLSNRLQSGTGIVYLPVHAWDLTSIPNQVSDATANPTVGVVLTRSSVSADADAGYITLASQNSAGASVSSCTWGAENTVSGASGLSIPYPMRKGYHCWSHIKINLYGVRKRATRFVVQLVMIKNRSCDFFLAADTNREKKKLYDYFSRPFMYNNLNNSDPLTARYIKVVKRYAVTVDPISLMDYGADAATPHIHTLNWFIKHDRIRRYDWSPGSDPGAGTNAAYDAENDIVTNRIVPEQRLYLMIHALSPEATTVTDNFQGPDETKEPSYDIVIRNKWMLNTP